MFLKLYYVEVPRHNARLIELEYVGEGPIDTTLLLVGKVGILCIIGTTYKPIIS